MSSRQLLPLSGVASVLLIVASFIVVGESPDLDAPASEVVSFYRDNDSSLQFGAALLALGAFFFLLFATTDRLAAAARPGGGPSRRTSASREGSSSRWARRSSPAWRSPPETRSTTSARPRSQTLHVLEMDMFFTVAVGTAAFLLGTGVGMLKSGAAASLARLGGDRDRRRRDHAGRVLRLPRARRLDADRQRHAGDAGGPPGACAIPPGVD